MTKVLFTGAFRFPDGDAAATRVRSVSRLFENLGCTVVFAGWESAGVERRHYVFEACDCYPQSEFRVDPQSLPRRLLGFLRRGGKTLDWLDSQPRFDIIVAYNPPAVFALRLLWHCWKRQVQIILDSTEWYDARHLPGGQFGPAAVENWFRMRVVYRLFRHVICISHFLEEYFGGRKGRNVVRIPPMTGPELDPRKNIQNIPRPSIRDGIAFVYAGEAGRKDLLTPFIRALPEIERATGVTTILELAGPSQAELRETLEREGLNASLYERFLRCHGRISRGDVIKLYARCHFSILFREDRRYAWAGFPTKALESWACGCPIICNSVGDLGAMGHDLSDCLFVDEDDVGGALSSILVSIVRSPNKYDSMSEGSRGMALRHFTPESCHGRFTRFFDRLQLGLRSEARNA